MKQTLTLIALAAAIIPFGLAGDASAQSGSGSRSYTPPQPTRQVRPQPQGSSSRGSASQGSASRSSGSQGSSSRATASQGSSMKKDEMMAKSAKLGLDGYCIVCVHSLKKWEQGDPSIVSIFDGVEYRFPGQAIKAKFDQDPQSFVPVLQGDCIVCLAKMGQRVPGKVQFPTLYNGRLYLFPSAAEKATFDASPAQFADADLALNGDCAVCLAKMGQRVAGSTQFTVIHNGLRYLFPSAKEAAMFRQQPDSFVSTGASKSDIAASTKPEMKSEAAGAVRLVGRVGCAGCEHGIRPLSSPDELGLALNTEDGKIIVVEEAHRLFPDAYESRFNGGQVEVSGKIVKTEGKISWLEPQSLRAIN